MSVWDMVRRTGQRQSRAFVLQQIPSSGADPGGLQPALVAEQDYFQVWLSQMFLGTRSTLTADWLPAAHARVSLVRTGRPPMEYSKVLRPEAHQLAQGVKLNYPLTPLIPFNGGMVEIEAALVAWQQSNRMDVAVELLQSVSALAFPLPAIAPALGVATIVTTAARDLVDKCDGRVHLNVHQSYTAGNGAAGNNPEPDTALRPTYLAVLLADENQVSPGTLRVVDSQLRQLDGHGQLHHLVGWDFLLLRVEGRATLDSFWLPEMEDLFDRAITALEAGNRALAESYRTSAIALVWRSPLFTWVDRDRIVDAVKARFDHVASLGLGAVPTRKPESLTELVTQYGPSVSEVQKRGSMSEASAFRA
jgi:hypothetical protein